MDIENTDVLKYTFMIIPFKFKGNIDENEIIKSGYFKPCDHDMIRYDRLYKHVTDCISCSNPDRSIFDYWFNREEKHTELFRKTLLFRTKTENDKILEAEGYLKDIYVYCFENGIGFIVLNFVFEENIDINTMCEILHGLKKIKRVTAESRFEILLDGEPVELSCLINEIPQRLNVEYDLFFQHTNKGYVSAVMLNSFTYPAPQYGKEKAKLEKDILHQLECLKRSQGSSYGTIENDGLKYIRPFKNMFWAFSAQGIANINYNDPEVGNIGFLKKFYRNVKREYLLMTLIVLNQEFMLIDYCQKFTSSVDAVSSVDELKRLYNFKIHGLFTTVSHLEHYRAFYSSFSEELGIQNILDEVNSKQSAIYLSNKNRIEEEKSKRDKKVNRFITVLSVILSVFGVTEMINNVLELLEIEKAWVVSLIVIGAIIVAVIAIMVISGLLDKRFDRKTEHEKKKK